MGKSTSGDAARHVAIIMDGNGRWAHARGLPRTTGHRAGVRAVRAVVEAAPGQGIEILTLYAFSADNWQRPGAEVAALLRLFERYLELEADRCVQQGVRVEVVGRRDRLPVSLLAAIERAEQATSKGRRMRLRLAIDYSSRDAIVAAAAHGPASRSALAALLDPIHGTPAPDVDLLVRTGGERRLSDFLLWECAYAELYFTELAWPAFTGQALAEAVEEFGRRQRRFGGLPPRSAARPRLPARAAWNHAPSHT